MKALIVIDLPDNLNKAFEEIRVDIKANLYGVELLDWRNQTIKPIPEKQHSKWFYSDDYYQKGWNACLDEILGDEE